MSPMFRSRRRVRAVSPRLTRHPRARLLLRPLEDRITPANLVVTDGGDSGGAGQLRAIWETARTNVQADTITFDPGVVSVQLTSALSTYAESQNLTIAGNGKLVTTIKAPSGNRIFSFSVPAAQSTITIRDIALIGGSTAGNGGAILDDNTALVFTNVRLTQNTSAAGGAIATSGITTITMTGCDLSFNISTSTGGGAIYLGAASTLTSDSCTFTNNSSVSRGGVFYSASAPISVSVQNSLISGNTAADYGGGIYARDKCTVTLTNDTFSLNTALNGAGGAISNAGSLTTTKCIFSSNSSYVGGAVANNNSATLSDCTFGTNNADYGGAVFCSSFLTVSNTSFSSNSAVHGGAIDVGNAGGNPVGLTVSFSNFSANSATETGGAIRCTGSLNVNGTTLANNTAGTDGGAIKSSGSTTLSNDTFTANTASGVGGAVSASTVTLNQCLLTSNVSKGADGGAISGFTTNASLCVFKNNAAITGVGGAVWMNNGTISFSQFEANTAATSGGAIHQNSGTTTISNVTCFQNTAGTSGGAINSSATITINQSTFTKNTAAGAAGGGAIASGSKLTINNSTIYDNTASGSSTASSGGGVVRTGGPLSLNSTIVAGNKVSGAGTGGHDIYSASSISIAGNNSLFGTNENSKLSLTGTYHAGTNAAPLDPLLNPLADNGGTLLPDGAVLKTMSLQYGSLAFDQGNNSLAFATDQRGAGYSRDDGPRSDIGAFEGVSRDPSAVLLSAPSVPSVGFDAYSFEVLYAGVYPLDSTTIDKNDVTVNGNGLSQSPTSVAINGSGTAYTVTYTIPAPEGGWGGINSDKTFNFGTYSVSLNGSQVGDQETPTHYALAHLMGTFSTLFAISFTITQPSDSDDGDYSTGQLSFREALKLANSNVGFTNTITFDPISFGSATTITIDNAAMPITQSVVINGPSASLTFDAKGADKQFAASATSVTLSNLTFTGFSSASNGGVLAFTGKSLTLTNVTFSKNTAAGGAAFAAGVAGATTVTLSVNGCNFLSNVSTATVSLGGAIYIISAATATVNSSIFDGNVAAAGASAICTYVFPVNLFCDSTDFKNGTTLASSAAEGGALFIEGQGSTVTIDHAVVSGNTTGGQGGFIYAYGPSTKLTITNSAITNNSSAFSGGAIRAWDGCVVTLGDSTISQNKSGGSGGAVGVGTGFGNSAVTVTVTRCTFSQNTSTTASGGGGAIYSDAGTSYKLSITSSTFANNTATALGGAIRVSSQSSIASTTFSGNSASGFGGAIYSTGASTVNVSSFSNNLSASKGGAIYTTAALVLSSDSFTTNSATSAGGAVRGAPNISSSTFSGNSSGSNGGALYNMFSGTATIASSFFIGNSAKTNGGAIHATAVNLTTSVLSNNTASAGGALVGAGTVNFCDFDSNSATTSGGAISGSATSPWTISNSTFRNNNAGTTGGAISTSGGLTVNQSTFTKNTASGSGGAIALASLTINNSTIYDNSANGAGASGGGIARTSTGSLILVSTIIAGNKIAGTVGVDVHSTATVSLGATTKNNLIGNNDNSGITFTDVTTNQLGNTASPIDPQLTALADYGGATLLPDGSHVRTMGLKTTSPAINKGIANGFTTDQRGMGFSRTIGPAPDVGAFEGVIAAPTVNNVTFGDGSNQRSLVKQIVVTFSEAVNFSPDVMSAFTLTRTGTGGPTGPVALQTNPINGPASVVTITFSGSLTEFGSLIDGFYDLTISAGVVSGVGGALDGNNDGIAGGSYFVTGTIANKFFRFYGDSDGDGTTGLTDFAAFRGAFNLGTGPGNGNATFNFDNDGNVGLSDFGEFRKRFNLSP